jgi:hypothetical protein
MQSPPVTMLHTLTCPKCREATEGEVRLVRARTVSEAVLDLIATYMSAGVRRDVSVCNCTRTIASAVIKKHSLSRTTALKSFAR